MVVDRIKETENYNILSDDIEMSFQEHIEEFRQRLFFYLLSLLMFSLGCFLFLDNIVSIVKEPAQGIKFFQFGPGEYLFTSLKIVSYGGILISIPILIFQVVLFLVPGMTYIEQKILIPMFSLSYSLFSLGLFFSYKTLLPRTINFLLDYGAKVVDPLWSFQQYFEFVTSLAFVCGIGFQIPILQLLLCICNIITTENLLYAIRYVIIGSTIISAIVTPTVDPFTQLFLSLTFIGLYILGIGLTFFIKRIV